MVTIVGFDKLHSVSGVRRVDHWDSCYTVDYVLNDVRYHCLIDRVEHTYYLGVCGAGWNIIERADIDADWLKSPQSFIGHIVFEITLYNDKLKCSTPI